MKKVCIIFLLSIIISLTGLGFSGVFSKNQVGVSATNANLGSEYLRIHIRADSNENQAQAVKYSVRDKVVEYLTPLVAGYSTQAEAVRGIEENLSQIERIASEVLAQKGFAYGAKAQIKREEFPTRVYKEYTLPAGEYTALILYLGKGEGDNWWCVVYPPLCFTATQGNVQYKSKIIEIIGAWRENNA